MLTGGEILAEFQKNMIPMNPKLILAVLALADTLKDGRIQRGELCTLVKQINGFDFEDALFKAADRDHNGLIQRRELELLRDKLGWTIPDEMEVMTREMFLVRAK